MLPIPRDPLWLDWDGVALPLLLEGSSCDFHKQSLMGKEPWSPPAGWSRDCLLSTQCMRLALVLGRYQAWGDMEVTVHTVTREGREEEVWAYDECQEGPEGGWCSTNTPRGQAPQEHPAGPQISKISGAQIHCYWGDSGNCF